MVEYLSTIDYMYFLQDYQLGTAKNQVWPGEKKNDCNEWGAAPLVCNTWRPLACAKRTQSLVTPDEGRAAYT